MFGIGFQKLAVLLAIGVALWTVFRIVRKLEGARGRRVAPAPKRRAVSQDMKECPVCGTYVAPAMALDCGRARCPYPKAVS